MPVKETSGNTSSGRCLRVAGLILRRNPEREFHSYLPLLPYNPSDYQILLRTWPTAPFKGYLGTFSGPVIPGQDPAHTLVHETQNWTRRLTQQARLGEEAPGISVRRAEFISVHGGGNGRVDPLSGKEVDMGVSLCYVLPTITRESSVVAQYPTAPEYPQFYDLFAILQGMMTSSQTVRVHPLTREMLSSLDKWLRERHALPGSINYLFSPSLKSRLKMFVSNPLHAPTPIAISNREEVGEEGDETADVIVTGKAVWPVSSSTPFQGPSDDSTLHETTAFSVAKLRDSLVKLDKEPADMVVVNPLFGSGVDYNQVDTMVVNRYFGRGVPDYDSLGEKRGKWSVQVEGDGMPDWIDLFPLHKCACEGDVEGVRRCVKVGVSPDERDTDSWTPLHYACWYGELGVVKVLVGEASADLGATNNTGSTPLHLAAATGHFEVVKYLLEQPGIFMVQTAIDCEGKSPLAVCLECRVNKWSHTAQLLREAYAEQAAQKSLALTPSLLSPPGGLSVTHNTLTPSPNLTLLSTDDAESLSGRGSLASRTARNAESSGRKGEKLVRRQRVDLVNGQHVLAHFASGKDTPAKHILQDIYKLIHLAPQYHEMVALWIQSESLEIQLGDDDRPLQLMSKWPSLLTQHIGKTTVAEIPKLCLRRNVFISQAKEKPVTDPTLLELLYADAKRNVLRGCYPCSEEEAIELGGLTMQVLYGDHVATVHHSGFLQDQLKEVLPVAMAKSRRRVEFERRVLTQHSVVSQSVSLSDSESQAALYKRYLQKCWQWPFYGAAFFPGSLATKSCRLPTKVKLSQKAHIPINIAVNTFGFHLVSMETNVTIASLGFESVHWDSSAEKHQVLLLTTDKSLHAEIKTRMAGLFHSLVSRMAEQYLQGSHGNASTISMPQTQCT